MVLASSSVSRVIALLPHGSDAPTRRRREVIAPCVWEQLAAAALALLRCQPALVLTGALRIPVLRSSSAVYDCPGGLDCRCCSSPSRDCQRLHAVQTALFIAALYSAAQRHACRRLQGAIVTFCRRRAFQSKPQHCTAQTPPPQRETRCSSVTNSLEPPPPPQPQLY